MSPSEFQKDMLRLIETFGKATYGTERCKLIWQEVKDFDAAWWTRTVDDFIGDCRFPPLMPEVREKASQRRSELYAFERESRRQEANQANYWSREDRESPQNSQGFKSFQQFLQSIREQIEKAAVK